GSSTLARRRAFVAHGCATRKQSPRSWPPSAGLRKMNARGRSCCLRKRSIGPLTRTELRDWTFVESQHSALIFQPFTISRWRTLFWLRREPQGRQWVQVVVADRYSLTFAFRRSTPS